MGWKAFASLAIVLASAACTTVRNEDAPPGGRVVTSYVDSAVSPFPPPKAWARVRLIVPAGTEWCESGRAWPPLIGGPQKKAQPNAANEVMLTVDPRGDQAHFKCRTPAGDVERTLDVVKFQTTPRSRLPSKTGRLFPPMVHISGPGADADQRWARLEREICFDSKGVRFSDDACRPDVFAMLKARDVGG